MCIRPPDVSDELSLSHLPLGLLQSGQDFGLLLPEVQALLLQLLSLSEQQRHLVLQPPLVLLQTGDLRLQGLLCALGSSGHLLQPPGVVRLSSSISRSHTRCFSSNTCTIAASFWSRLRLMWNTCEEGSTAETRSQAWLHAYLSDCNHNATSSMLVIYIDKNLIIVRLMHVL